jgi:hypothetical protein
MTISERRQAPRRVPDAGDPLARLRLRTGREVWVVDLSDGGSLVEGSARLIPGTHVDIHVTTRAGRVLVRSRVVRAAVSRLGSDGVMYRSALAFAHAIDTTAAGYAMPEASGGLLQSEGTPYPQNQLVQEGRIDQRLSTEAVITMATHGIHLG